MFKTLTSTGPHAVSGDVCILQQRQLRLIKLPGSKLLVEVVDGLLDSCHFLHGGYDGETSRPRAARIRGLAAFSRCYLVGVENLGDDASADDIPNIDRKPYAYGPCNADGV